MIVQLHSRLLRTRDAVREALGDQYGARMTEGSRALRKLAHAHGCGVLEMAIQACEMARRNGDEDSQAFIIAAAVELLSPSEQPG